MKATPPLKLAWFVWGLGALFYMMGFFQRVAPAVMTEELMRDFNISAAALGNLSGFYFYSYVMMQIPTGILADTWGPRRLLTLGSLVAGIGILLFALAPHIIWANIGRFLVGGSVAVAFVGCLKVSMNWFPPRLFAMVSGTTLLAGLLGAILAGTPLRLLMNFFNWRTILLVSALGTVMIGIAIWVFARDFPSEKGYADTGDTSPAPNKKSRAQLIGGIFEVFKYKNIIPLFFVPGGIIGCLLTFCGLWGVPFLKAHYNLPTHQAAALTSAALVAWGIGGPFFGWLSDRVGKRKSIFIAGYTAALFGCGVVFFIPDLPLPVLIAALILMGFSSGCVILTFAIAKESVPGSLAGTISGIMNMAFMIGPTLMQPAVGWVLDQKWQGAMVNGVPIYSLSTYQTGFALMTLWAALSLCSLFFTRETHCKQTV
ncbi:MAG: MFS transporter [Desulfobacterales bacterium]|nr:MFS transporter [Desulfobacterales bacterium]